MNIDAIKACNSLEELKALCEQTDELRTDLEDTRLVFGDGEAGADIMIVGEAPGENEDIQGIPFVGRGGQLLCSLIEEHIGYKRSELYIANILKHRPPKNRDPKPAERKIGLPYLKRQIELVNPKLILCVGRISAQTLLNNRSAMKDMRSQIFDFNGFNLTVTYHPAALLRNPNWKPPCIEDLKMIKSYLKS